MTFSEFSRGINKRLLMLEYTKHDGLMRRNHGDVDFFFKTTRIFNVRYAINVGIRFRAIEEIDVSFLEDCHMYFRLDRILSDFSEVILSAGSQDSENALACYRFLLSDVLPFANSYLENFLDQDWLRRSESTLKAAGMVKKQVRSAFFG